MYLLPEQQIEDDASDKTHITFSGGKLYYKEAAVQALDAKSGLLKFFEFIEKFQPAVLVAQNCERFD